MTTLAPGLPPLPPRFLKLPLNERGYPVPKFVWKKPDGGYDFRVIEPGWPSKCVRHRLCWLCGETLGKFVCFVIGPMCAINRNSAEPPSHRECAEFAVRACPFMRFPNRKRDEEGLPDDGIKPGGDAAMIMRNPGVSAIWVTTAYSVHRAPNGDSLFDIGQATEVTWWAQGRAATREEILHSINTGLPILREMAEKEGADAIAHLDHEIERGMKLLPA